MSACSLERVLAMAEGRLDPSAVADFERHAVGCAGCREALARARAARAGLAAARTLEPPEVDFGRVQARIREALDEPLQPARAWFRRPLALAAVAAAAAAAVVVGVRYGRTPPAPTAAVAPTGPRAPAGTTARLRAVPVLVQGEVQQVPGGAAVSPARPLDEGQGAQVGSGRLVLQLEAGTALVVAPKSEVAFRRLDAATVDVRLGRGKVYAQVAPRRAGQEFIIATAGHSVAVRGTRYSVERLPAATRVEVLEGVVEVHTVGTGWDRLGARVPAGTVMVFPDGASPVTLSGTGMTDAERAAFLAAARARLLADFADAAGALATSGVLEVGAGPVAGDVALDHEAAGQTPLALRATRGAHEIEITRPGYGREVRTIDLGADAHRIAVRLVQTGEENARAAELARHARVHQKELKACYDRELRRTPGLEGVIKIRLTLAESGRITAARALPGSGLPASVGACLVKTALRWQLGRGAPVTVDYPVVLKPELSFETP